MLVSVLLLTLLLTGDANHQNYDTFCSRYDTHVHSGDLVTCRMCVCVLLKQLMLLWLPQEVDRSCSMNIKTQFVCLALGFGSVMILRCCVICAQLFVCTGDSDRMPVHCLHC